MATQSATIARSHEATRANTAYQGRRIGKGTIYGIHYAQIMATAVLGGLPTLIAFLFFQRQIVQGFAGTGLKE